jgi:hypothetical protein
MDPVITVIATAVALGAAEGLKSTAVQAVTDAYAALKKIIQERYRHSEDVTDAVDYVAKKPDAVSRRQELEKALKEAGAEKDQELAETAKSLLAAVKAQPGGEEAVRVIINQQVSGSGHIFSGSGNVTVTR